MAGCTTCRQETNGRYRVEPAWPQGGFMSRPMDDRRWDVQAFTGRPVSRVPQGQWSRGIVHRWDVPPVSPNPQALFMYDPTDPVRYVTVVSPSRRRGLLPARKQSRRRGRR